MTENRTHNTLLSLLPPLRKASRQDTSDGEDSFAVESRRKLEQRIEWALGNMIAPAADHSGLPKSRA